MVTSFEDNTPQINEVREKINEYYEQRTKSCIFRSKARWWYGQGEKSTKYCFNLEKLRYNQKAMVCNINNDGSISKRQKEILDRHSKFYQKLY